MVVPLPDVNPAGPYSIFQAVSDAPADHVISTELAVAFDEARALGGEQLGQKPEPPVVPLKTPEEITLFAPSLSSQDTSLVQEPCTQFAKAILSPVVAENVSVLVAP